MTLVAHPAQVAVRLPCRVCAVTETAGRVPVTRLRTEARTNVPKVLPYCAMRHIIAFSFAVRNPSVLGVSPGFQRLGARHNIVDDADELLLMQQNS